MTIGPFHFSVLIPARDEEELLPRCLRSVFIAREALLQTNSLVTCDIVVAVDRSVDRTLSIAQRMLRGSGRVIRSRAGVVGLARAAAARMALEHAPQAAACTWLANTDADCVVPENWLLAQLALARTGIEAVAGVVDVDSFAEHDPLVAQRFRTTYLLHADGTHPHVHGANLGVRADAYLRAGGWADLATAEDHDLWHRLALAGAQLRSCSGLRVLTSGRRMGRAPLGFAAALAAHNEAIG
jgi:glycosyltransferase involved in cell wall biosynthesis